MNIWVIFRIAARAIRRNLMRSLLTTLGIIIGVAAVITMVSLGEGARAEVTVVFQAAGAKRLLVKFANLQRA